jgi:hypothetical protein
MNKSLGQIAYEKWASSPGVHSLYGHLSWTQLESSVRSAWEAVAEAVIEAHPFIFD